MSDSPALATFIFVDRRTTGRGKSLPNREKLLHRIKESIRQSRPQDIDSSGVKGGATAQKQLAGPVRVARQALAEPTFSYDRHSGETEVVLPGNDRWLKGDEFPLDGEGDGSGSGSGNGPGEDGEDDFIVNISRDEFLNVYFEDCELPDLEQTSQKELPEAVRKPAGFQKEGNPGQFSVIRSYRNSIGRRRALTTDDREEIEQLETEYKVLMLQLAEDADVHERMAWIEARIEELRTKMAAMPLFERVDHRYRKTERVMVKQAQAVLMMAMDISGSMDEDRKRLARKFFSLQYAFIVRKYPNTDLIFVYHTDKAEEVNEEEFFTSRKNGGTVASTAFVLANQIFTERYDPSQTNLYLSYATDGDNWSNDNTLVIDVLEAKGLLAKLRHAVYVQVGAEMGTSWGGGGQAAFWNVMTSISKTSPKLHVVKVHNDDEVFKEFKTVYAKKPTKG